MNPRQSSWFQMGVGKHMIKLHIPEPRQDRTAPVCNEHLMLHLRQEGLVVEIQVDRSEVGFRWEGKQIHAPRGRML